MRTQKQTYCFISDDSFKFYRAVKQPDGTYAITSNSQPYPLTYSPSNLENVSFEFGTNEFYFSLNRSVVEPLIFIEDGAAILRKFYHLGKGTEAKAYLTIVDWNGSKYDVSYRGKFDFAKKSEEPKTASFTVPTVDDSAWGVLSLNDQVEYAIECNATNPKAIRVLFDGMTLKNRFTYQTVNAPLLRTDAEAEFTIPFVKVNEDGDSVGLIMKDQTGQAWQPTVPGGFIPDGDIGFLESIYPVPNVNINGSIQFTWSIDPNPTFYPTLYIYFITTEGQKFDVFSSEFAPLIAGKVYNIPFDITLNLATSEQVYFVASLQAIGEDHFQITPIVTNTTITILTKAQPIVAWGLRPKDIAQQLVSKATNSRYTIDSIFFVDNNKDICFAGDSLRGVPNAKLYSTFQEFFKTFDALYFMGLRSINDKLWMEKATEIYRQDSTLIDIGEAIDVEIVPAEEMLGNELVIGSPDVDLRHPSGRLEFNCENSFSLPLFSSKQKIEVMTRYHTGCYEIQFLIIDYQNQSTTDNSGDKKVFVAKITNEQGTAVDDIETFENVTINNAPLAPIIKLPLENDIITYNKPVIRGIAKSLDPVNIYVDGVLDGGTAADTNGNWSYNIVTPLSQFIDGVQSGLHLIEATFTDNVAPVETLNIQINLDFITHHAIIYPNVGDSLYNNKPLIRGVAQQGSTVQVLIDGFQWATLIADASCRWEYKVTVALFNGPHLLEINNTSSESDSAAFNVDSDVEWPLITYIGSELDGEVVVNNLPLIQGVAQPGALVDLWLNYIQYVRLGQTMADPMGNWSFQTVIVTYPDPVSGIPTNLTPIPNGLNVISTSLVNHIVGINAQGYKLSRPAYSAITGVTDNTVFNTEYSPKRMLRMRNPLWAAICAKQGQAAIEFQKSSKNGNLRTVLNGVVTSESADVPCSSLGSPLMLMEYAIVKTKVNKTFQYLLRNFNKGGVIRFTYKGTYIYCLPIGSMKMNTLHSGVQEWKLLMSPLTSYTALLNLYRNGVFIKLDKATMFHSDYNTLHMVKYDYTLPSNYNVKDLYDTWFNYRNEQWTDNPDYIQKVQRGDPCRDQIVVNGISSIKIEIYRCRDARKIATIPYVPLTPAPINPPEIVSEAVINWTLYPEDQYFCVWVSGTTYVGISERVETRNHWPGTILIEANKTVNEVGFFFSSGIRSLTRVEGHIQKQQFDIENIIAVDQNRYSKSLHSTMAPYREIRFGTAYGLPDYLCKKIALQVVCDVLQIEKVFYTLKEGEKFDPSEDYGAHPLYYYSLNFLFRDNELGITQNGEGMGARQGVFLTIDAEAVGKPPGTVISIELDSE